MRRTSQQIISLAVVLCGPSLCAVGLGVPVSATSATVCANEQYEWRGSVSVAAGQSFATGIVIPQQAGTQVILVGSSSSADPFATSFVNVTVAGVVALEQAVVAGGEIAAVNIGADTFVLTTVGVAISRCHQVAQAAVATTTTTPTTTPTTTLTATTTATATATGGPNLTLALPETGRSRTLLGVAAALTTIGVSLLLGVRRRYSGSSAGR